MTRRAAPLLLLACCALALGACGLGEGRKISGPKTVRVTVSSDFGEKPLDSASERSFPAGQTVMQLLQKKFEVTTRYGGGFVQSIEGLSGGGDQGRKVDWFYYVNGIEAGTGAAERKVARADRIWWDHHDWSAAQHIPAVVGAFPEPFVTGTSGKRAPIVLQCGGEERSCAEVGERLHDAGVVGVSRSAASATGVGQKVLRVLVGPWQRLRADAAARQLESGPQKSGVFARPAADGSAIRLLDQSGRTRRTLGPGGGLVAATRFGSQQPTWVVTGTDDAGVAAAASAFQEGSLTNRFALAVDEGRSVPLPVREDR